MRADGKSPAVGPHLADAPADDRTPPAPDPWAASAPRGGQRGWADPAEGSRASTLGQALPLGGPREVVQVTSSCTACGACLATCPERALRRAPKRPLVVEAACTACWACIEICPAGAIEAVWVLVAPGQP